jgi:undecaprenyl-diphosphatase
VLHTVVVIAGAIVGALTAAANDAAHQELTAVKAILLGLVEGITEFLPISSTGHLIVTQRLIDVGREPATKDAADTYAITIQAGAILAVVVLYWRRLLTMGRGIVGRDEEGRQLTGVLVVAFVPAALIGVALEDTIKGRLFGVWPVIVAWAVGGVVILACARWVRARGLASGAPLEAMTLRTGLVIGLAQSLALWPGTSRSLVTIIAALTLGFSMHASVEFSFLLGLVTLTAATAYDALRHGSEMFDTYGLGSPILGFVVAFIAAVIAIRWMVGYLERHGLELFGWFRLGVAALALVLLATGVL